MGTTVSAVLLSTTGRHSVNIMMQIAAVLCLAAVTLGSPVADPSLGYGQPCINEHETILVKACPTESKVVGKKVTGHEDPVCEEVKGCAPGHTFGPGYGHPFGKREAEAQYGHSVQVGCAEITHKVCSPGKPILEDVTEEIETCSVSSKEVCEDIEKTVPKLTCKTVKAPEH